MGGDVDANAISFFTVGSARQSKVMEANDIDDTRSRTTTRNNGNPRADGNVSDNESSNDEGRESSTIKGKESYRLQDSARAQSVPAPHSVPTQPQLTQSTINSTDKISEKSSYSKPDNNHQNNQPNDLPLDNKKDDSNQTHSEQSAALSREQSILLAKQRYLARKGHA